MKLFTDATSMRESSRNETEFIDIQNIANLKSWLYVRFYLLYYRRKPLRYLQVGSMILIAFLVVFFLVLVENRYGYTFVTVAAIALFFYFLIIVGGFILLLFLNGAFITTLQSSHLKYLKLIQIQSAVSAEKNEKLCNMVDSICGYLQNQDDILSVLGIQMTTGLLVTAIGVVVSVLSFVVTIAFGIPSQT